MPKNGAHQWLSYIGCKLVARQKVNTVSATVAMSPVCIMRYVDGS